MPSTSSTAEPSRLASSIGVSMLIRPGAAAGEGEEPACLLIAPMAMVATTGSIFFSRPSPRPVCCAAWRAAVESGPEGLVARLTPYGSRVATWSLSKLGDFGMVLVQFALTLIGVVFLYRNGERIGARLRQFARGAA